MIRKLLTSRFRHNCLQFARGHGMSYGLAIVNPISQKPDLEGTLKVVYRCYEYGLILISLAGNILRIQPPLNISEVHMRKGFEILNSALDDLEAGRIPDDVLAYCHGW